MRETKGSEEKAGKKIQPFEYIGLEVEVRESFDSGSRGTKGKVVDETKGTLKIATKDGVKTVPKKGRKFWFPSRKAEVAGSEIMFRPEEKEKRME